jgi:hypothetical protein
MLNKTKDSHEDSQYLDIICNFVSGYDSDFDLFYKLSQIVMILSRVTIPVVDRTMYSQWCPNPTLQRGIKKADAGEVSN